MGKKLDWEILLGLKNMVYLKEERLVWKEVVTYQENTNDWDFCAL